ncbi:MAG: hypothetical protein H7A23_16780 [Leptospiraceae bacterium]|nr:hypothetical protein [Leptospiraceae bacterium]
MDGVTASKEQLYLYDLDRYKSWLQKEKGEEAYNYLKERATKWATMRETVLGYALIVAKVKK